MSLLNSLFGPSLLAATLAASLATVPAHVTAQNNREARSEQTEKSAREKAEEFIKASRAELKKENFPAARELFEKARTADPKAPGLDQLASDIAAAEKKAAEAKRSEEVDKLLKSANSSLKADRYEDALRDVSRALGIDPGNKDAMKLQEKIEAAQRKALEAQRKDQVEGRIDAAEDAIKRNDFAQARAMLASAREAAGGLFVEDLAELEEDINSAESKFVTRQNETQIKELLKTAEAQLDAKQFDSARATVAKVLEIDKRNEDANDLLAEIGEAEKAFSAEREAREAEEEIRAADSLLRSKKYEDAVAAYTAILKKDQGNKDAQRGLERAQKAMADAAPPAPRETRAPAVKPETAKPDTADADKVKGLVSEARQALRDKDIPKAESLLAQARTIDPKSREVASLERSIASAQQAAARDAERQARAAERRTEPVAPPTRRPEPPPAETKPAEPKPAEPKPAETVTAPPTRAPEPQTTTPPPTRNNMTDTTTTDRPARREAAAPDADAQKKAEEAAARKAEEDARKAEEAARRQQESQSKDARKRAEELFAKGLDLYKAGELERAREQWEEASREDADYSEPRTYLERTQGEYDELIQKRQARESFDAKEADAQRKMNTLIPFRTLAPTTLPDFLQTLRLLSGIDFVIVGEVNAKVEAAFEDEPLYEVLNAVLVPMGLRWRREPGSDTVIIEPDLRTEVFNVLPNQLSTINALIEEGVIARLLYGPSGKPVIQGQEIFTDPRQNILVLTDSAQNIEKVRRILDSVQNEGARTQLIIDSFEIDESRAPEIKALLSAILSADDEQPFNPERKLILEGSTLIIKDTAENIQRVRDILQDQNFLKRFYADELSVATFNLTPVLEFEENPDLVRAFADQVRQVVETLLYAKEGRSKAEREGRRLWYDPATLQLTITDTPDRLQTIQDYIESLPQIRSRRRSKIIFLDHAESGDLVGQIESFLGIEGGGTDQADSTADSVTKNLRTEGELEFRGAFFRVTTVNENDVDDDTDDSVELVIRTGTTSQESTIEEFRSEFVEDFEIIAEDIRPSGTPGEGRARLTIRYVPGGQGGTGNQGFGIDPQADQQQADQEAQRDEVEEETGLSLVDIENLNAIFVQYQNIEDLREVEFWVRTLDIPVLQVSIEVKFVEVITNKAKQLLPEFVISDLSEGFTLSDSVLSSRFAQDRDEFFNPFEPSVESFDSANLLKGTTVFNYIVNNGNSPISMSLRVLEAQGIINIVNGSTITLMNKETATFIIERRRYTGIAEVQTESTTTDDNQAGDVTRPYITPVDLEVEATVTRAGNITLDITAQMEDLDQNLGQLTTLDPTATSSLLPASTLPSAYVQATRPGTLYKEIETKVRIPDGGTVVLGGWRNERVSDLESGIPILRDIPFIGKYFFERMIKDEDKITLLIFLTGQVVRD